MAYAITQTCCHDASCVSVCPVNCIHPTPDEPDFGTADMLYVDPRTCIDCGACADACPVEAIFPVDRLFGPDVLYAGVNERYYEGREADNSWGAPSFPRSVPQEVGQLRVAIIGTGPAAGYTAQALLPTGAEITMIDRMPVSGGLLRFGVAPDHPSTRKIGDTFAALHQHPRLTVHLNIDVGKDLTHAEIAAHHHAVIYAVGAADDRALGIPGEDKAGSVSATTVVGWYNSHPEVPATAVDLSTAERVAVIGNGNVAVDVARILVSDPEHLAGTDIADHALKALRGSAVREVVLLGRRGPEHAAYSPSEFLALQHLPGVQIVIDDNEDVRKSIAAAEPGSKAALLGDVPVEKIDWSGPPPDGKRIVLRFLSAPTELCGDSRVESVRVTGDQDTISAQLVIRSIGYRSAPVAELPFDPATATVPNLAGRVVNPDTGEHLAGTYVVGWVKRGPTGGIGANRACSAETVDSLLDDAIARRLTAPTDTPRDFARLVRRRRSTGR